MSGAEAGTRTPTPEGTAPSRQRVYQFHHFRTIHITTYHVTNSMPGGSPLVGVAGKFPARAAQLQAVRFSSRALKCTPSQIPVKRPSATAIQRPLQTRKFPRLPPGSQASLLPLARKESG